MNEKCEPEFKKKLNNFNWIWNKPLAIFLYLDSSIGTEPEYELSIK